MRPERAGAPAVGARHLNRARRSNARPPLTLQVNGPIPSFRDVNTIHVISLGAGVQSSTMALMAARGDLEPMPRFAVFADTGDEPANVYEWLDWLEPRLPFPVYRHAHPQGALSKALLSGYEGARIPAFVKGAGMVQRQCTRDFKVRVIRRGVRAGIGVGPKARLADGAVTQWVGISTDEADRMKPSGVRFTVNRWPLIERGMSRADCQKWLLANVGRLAPKSSCVQCPFKADAQWREMKANAPADFDRACVIDEGLRHPERVQQFAGRELFLHRSWIPLREVDFTPMSADLFSEECEGLCGV